VSTEAFGKITAGLQAALRYADGDERRAATHRLRDGLWTETRWHDADGKFVATCDRFPSLSWLASTSKEADEGLRRLIGEEFGEAAVPKPESPDETADA
jgi:hypothetical protein